MRAQRRRPERLNQFFDGSEPRVHRDLGTGALSSAVGSSVGTLRSAETAEAVLRIGLAAAAARSVKCRHDIWATRQGAADQVTEARVEDLGVVRPDRPDVAVRVEPGEQIGRGIHLRPAEVARIEIQGSDAVELDQLGVDQDELSGAYPGNSLQVVGRGPGSDRDDAGRRHNGGVARTLQLREERVVRRVGGWTASGSMRTTGPPTTRTVRPSVMACQAPSEEFRTGREAVHEEGTGVRNGSYDRHCHLVEVR